MAKRIPARRAVRSTQTRPAASSTALDPQLQRRVIVENVAPQVDCGRFPIKRVVGEAVSVTADVHADGHDVLAAAVMYRRVGDVAWRETPMQHVGNDRWEGTFAVDELGRYEYTVEGWIDRFESWRYELSKKFGAGQDVSSELLEGGEIVREVSEAPAGSGDQDRPSLLSEAAAALANAGTAAELRVSAALSESLRD